MKYIKKFISLLFCIFLGCVAGIAIIVVLNNIMFFVLEDTVLEPTNVIMFTLAIGTITLFYLLSPFLVNTPIYQWWYTGASIKASKPNICTLCNCPCKHNQYCVFHNRIKNLLHDAENYYREQEHDSNKEV